MRSSANPWETSAPGGLIESVKCRVGSKTKEYPWVDNRISIPLNVFRDRTIYHRICHYC
jgi:hypothetical protein